jgi:type II secretory pathway component PulF
LSSFFMVNDRVLSEMSLVLALVSNGCTYEQTKKIIGCKPNSLQALVSYYFGKSENVHHSIRKYLSDEQCLRIWLMILNEKAEFNRKFLIKLVYPSFICIFTFVSMIFFKVSILSKIRAMFEFASNDLTFIIFDVILYTLISIYCILVILLAIVQFVLHNPNTKNYVYILLNSKFEDNLLTINTTGLFSKILLECFKSGVSTQNALEIIGKFSESPFVMLLARNCTSNLSSGNTFIQSISSLETDSSFKVFIQLGLYANRVIEQLNNYCEFNKILFESKLKNIINYYYAFVYIQFFISSLLLYQIIQIPLAAISSQI